jgi:hypothetical protein
MVIDAMEERHRIVGVAEAGLSKGGECSNRMASPKEVLRKFGYEL